MQVDLYNYDLLRQLAAQIKKTYIHKITSGNDYKKANDGRKTVIVTPSPIGERGVL